MKRLHLRTPRVEPEYRSSLLILANAVLVFLALAGTVFSAITLYGITVQTSRLFLAAIVSALAFTAVFSLPRYRWIPSLLYLLLLLLWIWRRWNVLIAAALEISVLVVDTLAARLPLVPYAWWESGLSIAAARTASTLLLSALTTLLGFGYAWSIIRERSGALATVLGFGLLLPGMLADEMPAWLPFMLLIAYQILVLLSKKSIRTDPIGTARFIWLAIPCVALLLTVLTLVTPWQENTRPDWAHTLRAQLEEIAEKLPSFDALSENVPVGAEVSLKLDQSGGAPDFSERTVLTVESAVEGRYYLRGVSAAYYTGEGWESLDASAYETLGLVAQEGGNDDMLRGISPFNFASMTAPDAEYYKMTIDYGNAYAGTFYYPYQLLSTPSEIDSVSFVNDSQIVRQFGGAKRTLYFKPDALPFADIVPLDGTARLAEADYRRFARTNYLEVPEGFEESFMEWVSSLYEGKTQEEIARLDEEISRIINQKMEQLGVPMYGGDATVRYDAVYYAATYAAVLAQTLHYDLDAPAVPEGMDFVDFFLNDSKTGYCAHFASAGVLMMRYLGIPARYVTGYIVQVPASGTAVVKDSDAHAWVEIYLDGYGWYPVEMTPPVGTGDALPVASMELDEPENPDEVEDKPAEQEEDKPQEDTPEIDKPNQPEEDETAQDAPEEPKPEIAVRNYDWLLYVLLLTLALAALLLRRRLRLRARERQLCDANTNAAVIAAYALLVQLEPWGGVIPEGVTELAQKAKFSQHTITEAERKGICAYAKNELSRVEETLSRLRKLQFRYVYTLK